MTFIWSIEDKQKRNDAFTYLFLCIFLGPLGVHRFYKSQIGLGILYLFTFGLLSIGWLVDIILAILGRIPESKKNAALAKLPPDFTISKSIRQGKYTFYIDDTNKRWTILGYDKIYKYSDILDFNVEENGSSIMQGKAGGAIIGGLTFGVVGALIGSSGKRKIKQTCDSLLLRISINDLQNPVIVIKYITYPVQKGLGIYSKAMDRIGELTATLTYMQKNILVSAETK